MSVFAETLKDDRSATASPSASATTRGAAASSHPASSVFQAHGLAKSFGGLEAVAGVDLSIATGRITALIGPNGAGKTSLLNIMSGVERPSAGRMSFAGQDVSGFASYRLAALGLVRTFQISRDLGKLTVLENLLLAQQRQTGETLLGLFFSPARVKQEEEKAIEKARSILERVDLWRLANAPASSLSGGQKKLLELCRALMLDPKLVLLDEPAAGVAPAMESILIDAIRSLVASGVSVLIVEHDLDVVAALSDHVYVMANGKILTQGSFDHVTRDARVVEAYLGLKT